MKKIISVVLSCIILLATTLPASATNSTATKYILGADSLVNTGKDTGYAEKNQLDKDDPHWGWTLGEFYVSDFTRQTEDSKGNPVFLKNVGDTVTLWFSLKQDIDCLNGDKLLTISEDINGWDQSLGVAQQDFGRGMLIVKHTDYQNNTTVTTYQNYLSAAATDTADIEVQTFEEGDYEIALDYEIEKAHADVLGVKVVPIYYNYRITFKFSIRNGNCMVFPFDVATGAELTNTAITENGFYLDLAKSRYLDIDIKKEVLTEGADGLVEDTRFNKPAKDGNEYTEEGIYTITVSNRYTNEETEKVIYVGTNNVLKACVVNNLSVSEVETQLTNGATITDDGTLIPPESAEEAPQSTEVESETEASDPKNPVPVIVIVCIVAAVMVVALVAKKRNKEGV